MNVDETLRLREACQIFLRHAYPQGTETIPWNKRKYLDLDSERPIAEFVPPAPFAEGIGQTLLDGTGEIVGYTFRLGCRHFPHLKLKVQVVKNQHGSTWLYAVDTHDAFSKESIVPPPDHPDAAAWTQLQNSNRALKEQIESAWEMAGLTTFKHLLRQELQNP